MRDLAELTADDFESFVGHEFVVTLDRAEPLTIRLVEVLRDGEPERRRPFSVHFLGPRAPVMRHEVHTLVNPEFGEVELFIGPVVADSDGTTYEAVFA